MGMKGNEDKGKTGERDPGSERTPDKKKALRWEDDIMHVETSFFYSCDATRTAVFNDSQVGRQNRSITSWNRHRERACVCGVGGDLSLCVCVALQKSIWDSCTYGPKLLPSEMKDSIFIQGQNATPHMHEADGNAQGRNRNKWSRGSERRGFKMFKAFGLVATAHRGSRITCRFLYVTWSAAQRAL